MEDLKLEIELLKANNKRLSEQLEATREELSQTKMDLDSLSENKLKLLAGSLNHEIREKFWDSIKKVLFVAAILASVATAGGILTVSDMLKNRVDAAVEGKQAELAKLRESILNSLVNVKVHAELANKEVDSVREHVRQATTEVSVLQRKVAAEAERAVTVIGVDVKGVSARLEKYRLALNDTQKKLDESQAQAEKAQKTLSSQIQTMQAALNTTQQQYAVTARRVSRLDIKSAQESLAKLGIFKSVIDGLAGPATRAAIQTFQRDSGLPVTGDLDIVTSEAIAIAAAKVSK